MDMSRVRLRRMRKVRDERNRKYCLDINAHLFFRYVGGHSHAHFMQTQHCYTMELGENRVWDYVGDNFVHRLVQSDSADGKLIEAEGNGGRMGGDCKDSKSVDGVTVNSAEKLDSIQLEYTYLLTSQLEAQRGLVKSAISF
jgi:BRCA1-associated protein